MSGNGESAVPQTDRLRAMHTANAAATLDARTCQQARLSRDARFDGLFYTAVKTTGIYCRPVCPAPPPKPHNIVYYANAAAAAAAGFRPCLRCRPEAAPGSPLHRAGSELVAGALRLIEDGALDRAPLSALCERIGVGERHLRRLFAHELGSSPLDVASTRRLLFAKQLLGDTGLPITEVAAAAGYASLRRFNAAFLSSYGKPPRELRHARTPSTDASSVQLRLPYRPPYDFAAMAAFHARRALPGVERVDDSGYHRTIIVDGEPGSFSVMPIAGDDALCVRIRGVRTRSLGVVAARVRRMFDVDADPRAIAQTLRRDALLKPLLRRWPGQRVPGAWDGFEIAVRAVLGQQVSVAAARTLAVRVVRAFGAPLVTGVDGLDAAFPPPTALLDAPLETLGITRARAATIRALAKACCAGSVGFGIEQTRADFVERLCALPGIGAWTAEYVCMRALSQPDAFPAADLVLRKMAGDGVPVTTRELSALADAWRPWRAYAVLLLWRSAD